MIDFHNHILPNIDDGASSLEVSLKMLEHASKQGITEVVNTVHYQHPKVEGLEISFKRLTKVINKIQLELKKTKIPIKLHLGAEVFYLPNLTDLLNDPLATLGNGKYMLVEFQPHYFPKTYKETFFNLKINGVTPIIAHPERYKPVQKNINIIYEWLNIGYLIQVDGGSVLGTLGKSAQITSEKIIKNKWCQFLGSDAHDLNRRNFNLKFALEVVSKWVDDDFKRSLVFDNPKDMLNGKPIIIDENEIKIETSKGLLDKFLPFR